MDIVVLYSAGHLGSAIVMNKLVMSPDINVVGVVKAKPLKISLKENQKIRKHLQSVGWQFAWLLLWQRLIQGLAYLITLLLPFLRKRIQPAWKIAQAENIPVHYCKNINDEESVRFIRDLKPDLLVSAYFSQILKEDVINLPKLGVLNVHPGWLPAYKGAMAYFWVLKNNTDKGGVTVHWIDEGIDTGAILARRSFKISEKSTQETVLLFTAVVGSNLLLRIVRQLKAGIQPKPIKLGKSEDDAYYPMPKEQDFDDYFKRRRFFRIRDVIAHLVRKNPH